MTHLTYTIAYIDVGAEKPYGEVQGRVASDLKDIEIKYLRTFNGVTMERKKILKQNPNHPLSKLANELGAIVYGGFENEKDFHLLLPTIGELKAGDYAISHWTNKNYDPVKGTKIYNVVDFGSLSREEMQTTGSYSLQISTVSRISQISITSEIFKQKINAFNDQKVLSPIQQGNIFQEYAKTGVLENDLYKQFFK